MKGCPAEVVPEQPCTHGPGDPPCQSAREFLSQLDAYEMDQKQKSDSK